MKNILILLKYSVTILILLGLLAGCGFFMGPETAEGTVTILLDPGNGNAKAFFSPDEISRFRYELEFEKPGVETRTLSFPAGTKTVSQTLSLGEWTITASAYNDDEVPTAKGRTTVTVTRGSADPVPIPMGSVNADLSGLEIKYGLLLAFTLSLGFDQNITSYEKDPLIVLNQEFGIIATTADPDATITINGDTADSGVQKKYSDLAMLGGKSTIQVVVTAQDRITTKTYTVTITRSGF